MELLAKISDIEDVIAASETETKEIMISCKRRMEGKIAIYMEGAGLIEEGWYEFSEDSFVIDAYRNYVDILYLYETVSEGGNIMLFDWIRQKVGKGHFWKDQFRKKDDTGKLQSLPYHSELGGFVPADYDITRHLEYNMYKIDKKIEELLAKTEVDQYNEASFLDEYIEARFQLVKNDLKRQGIWHKHIMNGLKIIREAQLKKIKNIRESLQEAEKNVDENNRNYEEDGLEG